MKMNAGTQKSRMSGAEYIRKEGLFSAAAAACGIFIILLALSIGVFLCINGVETFTKFGHSVTEFLFSSNFSPTDSANSSGGSVGASIFIFGSLLTCSLALLLAFPLSLAGAIYVTEIQPNLGKKLFLPAAEIFVGIPSVVYGWIGLTVLVPFIRDTFGAKMGGYSVLAAAIVLAVMIFPTIMTVSADAIRGVSKECRAAAYGLGSTRWQTISRVVVPSAAPGIFTGVILGLARALGEALAVAMVIGKTRAFPKDLLSPTNSLTCAIASDMGNSAVGGEQNAALWTMGLLLLLISVVCIFIIHMISKRGNKNYGR